MNLDFLDVLSQRSQKYGEQLGTVGTRSSHANLSVPNTSPATGNSGNKATASTANANTCSQVFPVYSQSMGTERTKVDAAVPGVPNENGHLSNAETGVLAEQETTEKRIIRWMGARCARSPRVCGSEKFLYRDYRGWCGQNNLPPCSREMFSSVLDQLFQRELDGWQELCLAADFEQAG